MVSSNDTVACIRPILTPHTSRNILIQPLCSLSDSNSLEFLTTAHHTLLTSTLTTWSPKYTLTPVAFVAFVQSVLDALPSSSSPSSTSSSNAAIFGEHLIDMIWAVDAALDEIVAEAKLTIAQGGEQGALTTSDLSAIFSKAKKTKQSAENDKETVTVIVRKLVVRSRSSPRICSFLFSPQETAIISPGSCRERLDSAVLASIGLISDKSSLDRKEIRARTGLLCASITFKLPIR